MTDPQAQFQRAVQAQRAGDLVTAERLYSDVMRKTGAPLFNIHCNLAPLYLLQGDAGRGEKAARAALALRPNDANALNNLGLCLRAQAQLNEAAAAFRRAVEHAPAFAEAWSNLADVLRRQDASIAAVHAARRAVAADPASYTAVEQALSVQTQFAVWDDMDSVIAAAQRAVAAGKPINPYCLFPVCLDPGEIQRAARNRARYVANLAPRPPALPPRPSGEKIRLGYFSCTLRDHATGYLLRGMLERHDRNSFELAAYVYNEDRRQAGGPSGESGFTAALRRNFDRVIDLTDLATAEAAEAIRRDAPHVLFDIDGYANGGRPEIIASRCAPLQVAWLGYLGTMGAPFIDAILADAYTIPPSLEGYYDERVIRLESGFFPGNGDREVSDRFATRADAGLPAEGVVFAAFNRATKLTPPILDAWVRILRRVPGSVLWLWTASDWASDNLLAQLLRRGLPRSRIVLAPSLPSPDHLCRYRFADLVLDCFPYNGHTMTSDALYCGRPVLTIEGRPFAARVAPSLLRRLKADALIARDIDDYVARAVALARDDARRAALAEQIAALAPDKLFDMAQFVRGFEKTIVDLVMEWGG